MTRRRAAALLLPVGLAAALAGCGSGTSASPTGSATSSAASPTTAAASPSSSGSATPSASQPPAPAPSDSGTATAQGGQGQAGVARCLSTQLEGSIQPGQGGAAGTVYQNLALKNVSQTPCLLEGFAGVSLTNGPQGEPIGAPADRETSTPVTPIILEPGQSGAAEFGLGQAGKYTNCAVVDAAGYRVYPPEDYGSLFIPAQVMACSNADIHLLTLRAFRPF
ncbi:DUF4232 domain-containing protein [Sinomonas flava]|uniref:DUF4232 domain-containing protein n=1 Tax=Sinomonas flava TaxID=496857 RepID=A0ABN3C1C5_9MICC